MSSRQGEVERLRAALAAERAERERLADKLASVLDRVYEMTALPATASGDTGPLPQVSRQQQSRRTQADQRWLKLVKDAQGFLVPAGLGGGLRATGAAFKARRVAGLKLAGAVGMSGAAVLTTVSLGPSHHLEFDTPLGIHWSPAVPGAAPVDATPMPSGSVQLIASTVHAPVKLRVKPRVKPLAVPVPVPVPVPVVTSPPPTQGTSQDTSSPDTSGHGSGQSDPSSQTTDPSQPSRPSQPSDWQAQGDHAAADSAPGDSGYQPRHGVNDSGSNYWQSGGQQDDTRQSGGQQSGRDGNWQHGSQQGGTWQGGQQGGGGWQQNGGQQGNHGGR